MAGKKLMKTLMEASIALQKYEADREVYLAEVKAYDEAMGEDYRFAKAIIQHIIGRKLD
tara:strand:+ start:492 stop:668 length:177 start_codon:yes stop_codon:yes gene_type:complete